MEIRALDVVSKQWTIISKNNGFRNRDLYRSQPGAVEMGNNLYYLVSDWQRNDVYELWKIDPTLNVSLVKAVPQDKDNLNFSLLNRIMANDKTVAFRGKVLALEIR